MPTLFKTLLFILFALPAFGQQMAEDIEVDLANLNIEKARDPRVLNMTKLEDGYLVLKAEPIRGPGGYHYFLEQFDESFKTVELTDISKQFEDDGYVMEEFIKLENQFIIFSSKNTELDRKEELFVQSYDIDGGTMGEPQKIHTQTYEKRREKISFRISYSPNKENILISIFPIARKGSDKPVQLKVLDKDLDVKYEINHALESLNEADHSYTFKELIIGNNSKIYALINKYEKTGRLIARERVSEEYEVVIFSEDGTERKTYDEQGSFYNIGLSLSESNELSLAGYYNKKESYGVDGTFVFNLDENADVIDKVEYDFSKEFITADWSDRAKKKADKKEQKGKEIGLSNAEFRRIIRHENGSMSIVGELFWITVHTSTDANGNTTTRTVYHYGDLIITQVSAEGEVIGNYRFKKHTTYPGAYLLFSRNNQLCLVRSQRKIDLLEDDRVETMTKKEKKEYRGDVLAINSVDEEGNWTKEGIIDYTTDPYRGHKRFRVITGSAHLLLNDKNFVDQIVLLTYFGKKQFGFTRLKL